MDLANKHSTIVWNDDSGNKDVKNNSSRAHSKNIFSIDENGDGMILVHSMPEFPETLKKENKFKIEVSTE